MKEFAEGKRYSLKRQMWERIFGIEISVYFC
jgi:hypothetical protein